MFYILGLLLLVAGVFFLIFGSKLYGQPKVGEQISAWRTLIPILNEPPQRFYTRLYQTLRASLQDRLAEADSGETAATPVEVVLTGMGFGPHRLFAAPSLFAERPLYILVRYKHLRCYIYAGQTPTGLFVSSWGYSDFQLGEQGLISLSKRALNYYRKQTLFQYDAALMFTHCVHEILSDIVDGYLKKEGLQPLEAMERRPVLHAFYQNPFHQNSLFPSLFSNSQPAQAAAQPQTPLFNLHHRDNVPTSPVSENGKPTGDSNFHNSTVHDPTFQPADGHSADGPSVNGRSTDTPAPHPSDSRSPSPRTRHTTLQPEPLFPMDEGMNEGMNEQHQPRHELHHEPQGDDPGKTPDVEQKP